MNEQEQQALFQVFTQEFIDPLWQIAQQAVASLNRVMPVRLCHYTDAAGLKGIIESRRLWATSVGFVNDSTEFDYAWKAFQDEVERRLRSHIETPARKVLQATVHEAGGWKRDTVFAISFSEDADDLSQWRSYGSDGYGYCLVLPAKYILTFVKGWVTFGNVNYGAQPVKQLVSDYVEQLIALCGQAQHQLSASPAVKTAGVAVNSILSVQAPFFKHPGFHSENEWRLVAGAGLPQYTAFAADRFNVLFRLRGRYPVPYVALAPQLDGANTNVPIDCVITGPSLDKDTAQRAVRMLLDENGYEGSVEIRHSEMPYVI